MAREPMDTVEGGKYIAVESHINKVRGKINRLQTALTQSENIIRRNIIKKDIRWLQIALRHYEIGIYYENKINKINIKKGVMIYE